MITVLHRGGYAQMITILHRGGGPLGTPKRDYVICARPLTEKIRWVVCDCFHKAINNQSFQMADCKSRTWGKWWSSGGSVHLLRSFAISSAKCGWWGEDSIYLLNSTTRGGGGRHHHQHWHCHIERSTPTPEEGRPSSSSESAWT